MLLATLSRSCTLAPAAIQAIIAAMATCVHHTSMKKFIRSAVSLCSPQDEIDAWSRKTVDNLLREPCVSKPVSVLVPSAHGRTGHSSTS